MARTTSRRRSESQQERRPKLRQMDLFANDQSGGLIGAPAWSELPAEVQRTLTNLMAQLILEHADRSKTAVTREADHDL